MSLLPPVSCVSVSQPASSSHAHCMARVRSLFRATAASALLGALAACGGGGGDGGTPTPPPPSPTPSPTPGPASGPIDAVLSVPDPVGYDTERLAAFNRLNEIRLSAGLGMVAQQVQIDQAAQAHADWMVANNVLSHVEVAGTPGFTGENVALREEAKGYAPGTNAMEVICGNGSSGSACVDLLVNIAYHRIAVLTFEPVDVGIGRSALSVASATQPVVIDLASPGADVVRGLGQKSQAGIQGVVIWPLNGSTSVPLRMGNEIPNPVPAVDVQTLGTPISVGVAESKELSIGSFTLIKTGSNSQITSVVLDRDHDPNGLVPPSWVVSVPVAPLEPSTTYIASFTGTATDTLYGTSVPISRTWTFTTAAN